MLPRRIVLLLLAFVVSMVAVRTAPAAAAELVMFDAKWCGYCKKFHREVGETYGQSDAARIFPLRVIDIDREKADFTLKERVRGTPTFVIVEDGREIGRFSGYASPERFYETMDRAVAAYRRARGDSGQGRAPAKGAEEDI